MLLWHDTFLVNSLAHVMGRRRYATNDTSRNSVLVAIATMGEGWHNNHHYFQASARNGFFWWEIDVTYYVLKGLSFIGLVRDLKVPSAEMLAANRVGDGNFDMGMFKAHWAKAQASVAHSHANLQAKVVDTRAHATETLQDRRDALGAAVEAGKSSVDELLHASMAAAEELARSTRLTARDLRPAEG